MRWFLFPVFLALSCALAWAMSESLLSCTTGACTEDAKLWVVARARPKALPDNTTITCTKNDDGTGTVTITGVDVKRFEVYIHAPTSAMKAFDKAASYNVPLAATFNFFFKGANGEDNFARVGGETPAKAAAKVFHKIAGGNGGVLDGVVVVPDAVNGGVGFGLGGASFGCRYMVLPLKNP